MGFESAIGEVFSNYVLDEKTRADYEARVGGLPEMQRQMTDQEQAVYLAASTLIKSVVEALADDNKLSRGIIDWEGCKISYQIGGSSFDNVLAALKAGRAGQRSQARGAFESLKIIRVGEEEQPLYWIENYGQEFRGLRKGAWQAELVAEAKQL